MLKRIVILLIGFVCLFSANVVQASETVNLYLFTAEGCPHCADEKEFLSELLEKDRYKDSVEIHEYEINAQGTLQVLQQFANQLDFNPTGVPVTIIGNEYWIGFGTSAGIDQAIIQALDQALDLQVEDPSLIDPDKETLMVNLPLFGEVDLRSWSLPGLTIVLGFLDGFNPCAMWALIFLISLLLNMKNKTRMWILGVTFIVTSALVYLIFMAAWLNFILFIGLVFWVRMLIGAVAIGGGGWNLKKFWTNKEGGCEISEGQEKRQTLEKLKKAVYSKSFIWSLFGIIALAFTVNLIELVCSAGLPAVYTQVLAMNDLTTLQHYGYLLLYIFFFLIDDLFVFFIAMTTLRLTGISTKYSRWSSLIGGILMIVIGLLMWFKHEWLLFG